MLRRDLFDHIVIGPADNTLPDMLDESPPGTIPAVSPNTVFRRDDEVRRTEIEPVTDLDALPFPDFSQIDLDRFPNPVRILPVQWGRGCSWRQCAFCHWTQHYFGQHNQAMSVERFVDTIEHLRSTYDTSFFTLQDTELPPLRARKLSHALLERFGEQGISLAVHFGRLIKAYDDPDLFVLMRHAGIVAMGWGSSRAASRCSRACTRGPTSRPARPCLARSRAAGISNHVSVMFGFPGETDGRRAPRRSTSSPRIVDDIDGICSVAAFELEPDSLIGEHPEDGAAWSTPTAR